MFQYSAIIIDDEIHARKRLHQLLGNYDQIEVVGEAANGNEGAKLINTLKPSLIFLDINMPLLNGFEMLQQLSYMPKIIFTTAYEDFALKAFEQNSIDYLLKPFSAERLGKAIEKVERLSHGIDMERLKNVLDDIKSEKKLTSLTISVGDRLVIVLCNDILFIKSEDKCAIIYDNQNNEYLTYHSLSKLSDRLPGNFLQVHRAFLINKDYIHEIRKGFKGQLVFVMKDEGKTRISTGKTFLKEVKKNLDII